MVLFLHGFTRRSSRFYISLIYLYILPLDSILDAYKMHCGQTMFSAFAVSYREIQRV